MNKIIEALIYKHLYVNCQYFLEEMSKEHKAN